MTATDDAFASAAFGYVAGLRIELPDTTLRLLNGSGVMDIDGETYTGRHATYGVWSGVEAFTDGLDQEAPTLRVNVLPPSTTALAALIDPGIQGCGLQLRIGAFVKATGLVVDEPKLVFDGEIDVPTARLSRAGREVEFDCITEFERLFDTDTGALLNHAWLTSIFAGDMGLQYQVRVLNHAPAGATYGGGAGGWRGGTGLPA